MRNRLTIASFECDDCGHEWWETLSPARQRATQTCPNCRADDGDNCWDCGESFEDDMGGDLCTDCRHTLCWDCTGGMYRSYRSPHHDGREADKGLCGATARVL